MADKQMEQLVQNLKELDDFFGKPENKKFLSPDSKFIDYTVVECDTSDLQQRLDAVDELANEVLIDGNGGCRWNAHAELSNHGFPVRCGERDSFGWLTGIIGGKNFDFVYG